MGFIQKIKDLTGKEIFPVTVTDAIYNEDGTTITETMITSTDPGQLIEITETSPFTALGYIGYAENEIQLSELIDNLRFDVDKLYSLTVDINYPNSTLFTKAGNGTLTGIVVIEGFYSVDNQQYQQAMSPLFPISGGLFRKNTGTGWSTWKSFEENTSSVIFEDYKTKATPSEQDTINNIVSGKSNVSLFQYIKAYLLNCITFGKLVNNALITEPGKYALDAAMGKTLYTMISNVSSKTSAKTGIVFPSTVKSLYGNYNVTKYGKSCYFVAETIQKTTSAVFVFGDVICTLPTGYIPETNISLAVTGSTQLDYYGEIAVTIQIRSDGAVIFRSSLTNIKSLYIAVNYLVA